MRIGDLRHRVTLQRPTEGVDELGNPTTVWQDVATVWASVEPLRGQRQLVAQQAFGLVTYRIRMRYRRDVSVSWRVIWDGRVLEARAALDVEGRHRELEVMAVEVVQ